MMPEDTERVMRWVESQQLCILKSVASVWPYGTQSDKAWLVVGAITEAAKRDKRIHMFGTPRWDNESRRWRSSAGYYRHRTLQVRPEDDLRFVHAESSDSPADAAILAMAQCLKRLSENGHVLNATNTPPEVHDA